MEWKKELASSFRSAEDLPEGFRLSASEKAYFTRPESQKSEFSVPLYYFSLAGKHENDPVRIQSIPRIEEFTIKPFELSDPLGENLYKVTGRLIHRYRDRVLFLATDSCAMYCRHCFRKNFTGRHQGPASMEEVKAAAEYIAVHSEVTEIILSGGDPLMLDTSLLKEYLSIFREAGKDLVFRIGTRMPVVLPSRVDAELVSMLKGFSPLFIMTQFNHPAELTEESIGGTDRFINAGIPVFNQTVLLRDVNDTADVLEKLFHTLVRCRIKPYYLFQGDLAAGTSHLRVPLSRGFNIMKELRLRLSGLSLPVFAVDLPGGGGKVPLTESYISECTESGWKLRDTNGKEFFYPEEL